MVVHATVDGKPGRFLVGTAQPRSVMDRRFRKAADGSSSLVMGERFSRTISPVVDDLGGLADGILGADVWQDSTLTIDYSRQLIILSHEPADAMDGSLYRFTGPPALPVTLDGVAETAIIDTALPDSLVLPSERGRRRGQAALRVGSYDLGTVEIGFESTSTIRMGNRILARFLIKIDYRKGVISLWRDPRRA